MADKKNVAAKAEEVKKETAPVAEAKAEVKAEETKKEAAPATKKATEKKAAKAAPKKETKAAAKAEPKKAPAPKRPAGDTMYIEFNGGKVKAKDILADVKAAVSAKSKKKYESLEVYLNINEGKAYYVVDGKGDADCVVDIHYSTED